MTIVWMRQRWSRLAHAFAEIDLSAGFERLEPLGACGRLLVAALERDDQAEKCAVCVRAVHRMEHRHT